MACVPCNSTPGVELSFHRLHTNTYLTQMSTILTDDAVKEREELQKLVKALAWAKKQLTKEPKNDDLTILRDTARMRIDQILRNTRYLNKIVIKGQTIMNFALGCLRDLNLEVISSDVDTIVVRDITDDELHSVNKSLDASYSPAFILHRV